MKYSLIPKKITDSKNKYPVSLFFRFGFLVLCLVAVHFLDPISTVKLLYFCTFHLLIKH